MPRAGAVAADELIAFAKTLIAGYKCPRSVEVRETPLPLSGAGKILKRDLRRKHSGRPRAPDSLSRTAAVWH